MTISPYRSLPVERRISLVAHAIHANKQGRALFMQRLASRPGGFRIVTLQSWPVDRLAAEVVRLKAETAQDELELLQLLYVELEPEIQMTFLDAAGVKHERGQIAEELQPPYTDDAGVERGARAVVERHGEDGARYLRTLAKYSQDWWPGIDRFATQTS